MACFALILPGRFAKADCPGIVVFDAHGDDYVEFVVDDFAGKLPVAFILNDKVFLYRCLWHQFAIFIYLFNMLIDFLNGYIIKLFLHFLHQSDILIFLAHFHTVHIVPDDREIDQIFGN